MEHIIKYIKFYKHPVNLYNLIMRRFNKSLSYHEFNKIFKK
jgi:hypothetical protein